jgi:hypothetical protein
MIIFLEKPRTRQKLRRQRRRLLPVVDLQASHEEKAITHEARTTAFDEVIP